MKTLFRPDFQVPYLHTHRPSTFIGRTPSRRPFAPLAALVRMVTRNGGVHPKRIHVLALTMFRYVIFEPLRLAERFMLDRKIEAHILTRDPIFILGHWRSGTSYLQTLLKQDPRFTTGTLYRCLFADIFCTTESWLKPMLNAIARALRLPFSLQRMPFDFDHPAEGDVALCAMLSPFSSCWGQVFPQRFEEWMDRSVLRPEPEFAEAWLADYDRFIRKLSFASGGKQVVIKSPSDTARVGLLLSRYPNARFVYIHRDPRAVFCSNRHLWDVIRREASLHVLDDSEVDPKILRMYRPLLESYLEQRSLVPPGQLTEVRFEDLQSEPLAEITQVYEELGLGEPPVALNRYLSEQTPYPTRTYDVSPEVERRLHDAGAFAFEDWPPPDPGNVGAGDAACRSASRPREKEA